jgi:hypothetical protein
MSQHLKKPSQIMNYLREGLLIHGNINTKSVEKLPFLRFYREPW